jgi:hypothetical protein
MAATADDNIGFLGEVTSAETPLVLGKGAMYSMVTAGALRVTAGGTGDRAVTIAAGQAWGDGVLSIWNTGAVLNLDPASGSDRWDTIVIRRTWQPASTPTGTAVLMALAGGTSQAIAATRTTDRGVTTSDQPIALVRVRAGSATISSSDIVDLRCWSGQGGGLVAQSEDALQYLADPGTEVRIGDTVWSRQVTTAGALEWKARVLGGRELLTGASASASFGSGWSRQASCRLERDGDRRWVHMVAARTANLTFNGTTGSLSPYEIVVTLHSEDAPPTEVVAAAFVRGTGGTHYNAVVRITTGGAVILEASTPGVTLGPDGPDDTIVVDASYYV